MGWPRYSVSTGSYYKLVVKLLPVLLRTFKQLLNATCMAIVALIGCKKMCMCSWKSQHWNKTFMKWKPPYINERISIKKKKRVHTHKGLVFNSKPMKSTQI